MTTTKQPLARWLVLGDELTCRGASWRATKRYCQRGSVLRRVTIEDIVTKNPFLFSGLFVTAMRHSVMPSSRPTYSLHRRCSEELS